MVRFSLHKRLIRPELIPVSVVWSNLEYFFSPPPGWMLVHCIIPPALNLTAPIHTPVWREALWEKSVLPKNKTQCPQQGLDTGHWTLESLAPESSALTTVPTHLPRAQKYLSADNICSIRRKWFSESTAWVCYCELWGRDNFQGQNLSILLKSNGDYCVYYP